MIQTTDLVTLAAIFGGMVVCIVWPGAGAPCSPYLMVFLMVLLFLSFPSLPMESILRAARACGLQLWGWLVLKPVILRSGSSS